MVTNQVVPMVNPPIVSANIAKPRWVPSDEGLR